MKIRSLSQDKQHWLEHLNSLEQLVDAQLLPSTFKQELDALRSSIAQFNLNIPLIGKFSAGKSTLINAWLNSEMQSVDLLPCTDIATEFHYTDKPEDEKMVVHYATETKTLPLSDYAQFKQQADNHRHAALKVSLFVHNAALAKYPELVIVDAPGLGANNDAHYQAIVNYIGESAAFILCVTRLNQVGVEELTFVQRLRSLGQDFSLLVCQEDLNNPSEREAIRQTLAAQASVDEHQLVRGCSAKTGDVAGFDAILAHFYAQQGQLFYNKFSPLVYQLAQQAKGLIEQRLARDMTQEQLKLEQTKLEQGMTQINSYWQQEQNQLQQDISGHLARHVQSQVVSYLHSRHSNYVEQVLQGASVQSLIQADTQNALSLTLASQLTPRLTQSAQKLGHLLTETFSDGFLDIRLHDLRPQDNNNPEQQGKFSGFVDAVAPIAMMFASKYPQLAAVVGVVKVLAALFDNQANQEAQRRQQAESVVAQAIGSIAEQIPTQIQQILQQQAQRFMDKMREHVETQLKSMQENLQQLSQQIAANQSERDKIVNRLEQALAQIDTLLTTQEAAA
jgi:hypothetical protein